MEPDYITRKEHEAFTSWMKSENSRLDDEDKRVNQRLILLENTIAQINALTVSVESMAVNMGNMLKELERQGERIGRIEREPADSYRQIKTVIITAIVTTVVTAAAGAVLYLIGGR